MKFIEDDTPEAENQNVHDFEHYELCICPNCNFEFEINRNNLFYFDQKNSETIDFKLDFKNKGLGFTPLFKGQIKQTYCIHCNNFISTYSINEINSRTYENQEIIDMANKGIIKHLETIKKQIREQVEDLTNNKEYSFKVTEYGSTFFIKGYPFGSSLIDCSNYPSKNEALIEGYNQIKKEINNEINQINKKLINHYQRMQNTKYLIEIDLKNYKEMIELISSEIKGENRKISQIESIDCPICYKKIPKIIYRGVCCPKCNHELILNEDLFLD